MNKSRRIHLVGLVVLAGILMLAMTSRSTTSAVSDEGQQMALAAQAYLGSLGAEKRAQGTWSLDAEQRFDWHFVPRERYGVRLKDMTSEQRGAARRTDCFKAS